MAQADRQRDGVAIVGGGLVGSLLAVFLARRGIAVTLYERRPDPRLVGAGGGRSINLVVTSRGIAALRRVGLERDVLALSVPVRGRMMHSVEGRLTFQPYGKDDSECNHSISRGRLNEYLLTAAERAGVRSRFELRLVDADPRAGRLTFAAPGGTQEVVSARVALGADGAASVVRASLMRLPGHAESIEMLEHGYKELEIPPAAGGAFRLDERALHIWPRGGSMMMALPNPDGSFTVTLYLPHRGPQGFAGLDSAARVQELFRALFPDALPLIPGLDREFFSNPTGELGTVRCGPWNCAGRTALVGDAAHALVPFFGQGMNCGFEDCTVLDELLERYGADFDALLPEYARLRKPEADAIADMALENFVEMRDRVGDPAFLLRKQVEHRLEQTMPREYRSRYSMVAFSLIPYSAAREAGRIQDGILDELCRGLRSADELDLDRAQRLVAERLTPFLRARSIRLDY